MRKDIFLAIVLSLVASFGSYSCSKNSSGGGGSVDKAAGTFITTSLKGSTTFSTDIGTITFDGAGHGTYASLVSSDTGTFKYTLTVPGNDLIIDDTLIGSLSAAGNFFAAVDVSSSVTGTTIMMVMGVKKGSGITDNAAITYVGGDVTGGMTPSQLGRLSIAFHTPLASVLTYTNLTSGGTGTIAYALASDGTFTIDPSSMQPLPGAVSNDKSIMIYAYNIGVGFALQLPGTGMTNALLNGTYKAYRFADNNVSGPSAFSAGRTTWTFNGFGDGQYQRTADSGGVLGQGTQTYTVFPDGTFVLGGSKGISLADGSVIAFFSEAIGGNNSISTVIAIKQ